MKEGSGDLYFDFSKEEKDHAIRFLLEALIRSRGTYGFPSNQKDFDEDVNIYLAHLLFAISTSQYQQLTQRYIMSHDSDLARMVGDVEDNYLKYFIYKVNADNLLVHLSIFGDLLKHFPSERQIIERTEGQFFNAARAYYEQAAMYNKRIYRKQTAVGDVLGKLSKNFDFYCSILQVTRKDYFQFAHSFKEKGTEGHEIQQVVKDFDKDAVLKEKQDLFLDLYFEWLTNNVSPGLKTRINEVCEEIQKLDPKFRFRID